MTDVKLRVWVSGFEETSLIEAALSDVGFIPVVNRPQRVVGGHGHASVELWKEGIRRADIVLINAECRGIETGMELMYAVVLNKMCIVVGDTAAAMPWLTVHCTATFPTWPSAVAFLAEYQKIGVEPC